MVDAARPATLLAHHADQPPGRFADRLAVVVECRKFVDQCRNPGRLVGATGTTDFFTRMTAHRHLPGPGTPILPRPTNRNEISPAISFSFR